MPRRIDQQSLDAIASRHVLSGTQSLLDNTLSTINNKMAQREHQQMSQMRSQQIQQQGMELAEFQKQADVRAMETEKRRLTTKHDLSRIEKDLQASDEQKELDVLSTRNSMDQQMYEATFNAVDNEDYQARLDSLESIVTPTRMKEMRRYDFDNESHKQQAQHRAKYNLDHARAMDKTKASSEKSLSLNMGTGSQPAIARWYDSVSDFSTDDSDALSTGTVQWAKRMNDAGYGISAADLAQEVAVLYEVNPDGFEAPNDNWFFDGPLDHSKLVRAAVESILGKQEVAAASTQGATSQETIAAQKAGVSPAKWMKMRQAYPNMPVEELIMKAQQWRANQ